MRDIRSGASGVLVRLLLLCCWMAWHAPSSLAAEIPEILTRQTDVHHLDGRFEILRDPGGKLPSAHPPVDADFKPLASFFYLGYTPDAYWLRFTLRRAADAPREWLLDAMPSFLDRVDLYIPSGEGYVVRRSGDHLALDTRDLRHKNFTFYLDLPDEAPRTYYLRVQSTSTMYLRASVWQPLAFLSTTNAESWLYGLFFGAWGIMVLVNLLFLFWLRGAVYKSYLAYLVCEGLSLMAVSGYHALYLLPGQAWLADKMAGAMIYLSVTAAPFMIVEVLELPRHYPRLARALRAMGMASLAGTVVVFGGAYSHIVGAMFVYMFLLDVTTLVLSVRLARHGSRPARWMLYAFLPHLLGIGLVVLRNLGAIPPWDWVDFIMLFTTSIHMVFINIGLAVRFKEAMDARRQAKEMSMQAANEIARAQAQQQFVGMISHELRNPVATMELSLESLRHLEHGASPEVLSRYRKIRNAQQQLRHLIDNYLTRERIKDGRFILAPGPVNVAELLAEIARAAAERFSKHNLQIHATLPSLTMQADSGLLKLVIHNLIDNAAKYSPAGGEIRVEAAAAPGGVQISVADQGPGIPGHDIPLLFDAHYRGEKQGQGVGLGLYLVKQIIQLHGGTATVASRLGEGSTFTLWLPLGTAA